MAAAAPASPPRQTAAEGRRESRRRAARCRARCAPRLARVRPPAGPAARAGSPRRRRPSSPAARDGTPAAAAAVAGRERIGLDSGSSASGSIQGRLPAAGEARWANRRAAGTCCRRGRTTGRSARPRAVARSRAAAAARCPPARSARGRTRAPVAPARAGRAASRPRPRRWPAGDARARGNSACPRRPAGPARIDLQAFGQRGANRAASAPWRRPATSGRRTAQDRATPARHRRANGIQRPARQLLAWILLADGRLQRGARRPERPAAGGSAGRRGALGRAERVGVPLRRIDVGGGDEGRLAAHGQPHVAARRVPDPPLRPAPGSSCHCASL